MRVIRCMPEGGDPFDLEVSTRDLLAWEKTAKGKTVADILESVSMVEVYRLAHLCARRTGMFAGDLAEFEATVDVHLDPDEGEDEPDPTPPARSAGRSSRSRARRA